MFGDLTNFRLIGWSGRVKIFRLLTLKLTRLDTHKYQIESLAHVIIGGGGTVETFRIILGGLNFGGRSCLLIN